jgi:nucleotide-binding universal stress UspA family protein
MPIKSILVPVDGTAASARCLEAAFLVALAHAAHVEVLHVRADPKDAVPLLGEGMSGAMIEEMVELAEKEAADRSAMARKIFDDSIVAHGLLYVDEPQLVDKAASSWVEVVGREDEALAVRGRLADLSVVARPMPDADLPTSMTLNAAIFETGRPVLVVPPVLTKSFGNRLAISWNGSAESARAVACGIPFLQSAKTVHTMAVHSARTPPAAARGLREYLGWNGIASVDETIEPEGRAVGHAVLRTCSENGVDMLIMGAYTRSRMRQLILGGVTRYVLENAEIPVLMAR